MRAPLAGGIREAMVPEAKLACPTQTSRRTVLANRAAMGIAESLDTAAPRPRRKHNLAHWTGAVLKNARRKNKRGSFP